MNLVKSLAPPFGAAIVILLALAALSFNTPLALAAPDRVLTEEQEQLVAEKERALAHLRSGRAAGSENIIDEPQPTRTFTERVFISREDAQAAIDNAVRENSHVWDAMALSDSREAAEAAKSAFIADQLDAIAHIPAQGIWLDVPGVEVGTHSVTFSTFTYMSGNMSDPTNLVFYNVGSAADVEYDLRNWTSTQWEDDAAWLCVSQSQDVFLWEASHTGGTDHWKSRDWGAQRTFDACAAEDRMHVRIFGASVPDSHGTYGEWTVGAAHYERVGCGGHCLRGWEDGENAVKNSFYSGGTKLWFVGDVWYGWFNNAGTWKGYSNDGYGPYIELTS